MLRWTRRSGISLRLFLASETFCQFHKSCGTHDTATQSSVAQMLLVYQEPVLVFCRPANPTDPSPPMAMAPRQADQGEEICPLLLPEVMVVGADGEARGQGVRHGYGQAPTLPSRKEMIVKFGVRRGCGQAPAPGEALQPPGAVGPLNEMIGK